MSILSALEFTPPAALDVVPEPRRRINDAQSLERFARAVPEKQSAWLHDNLSPHVDDVLVLDAWSVDEAKQDRLLLGDRGVGGWLR